MNELVIDVGVFTLLHINLSEVDFTGIREIVFTVKNFSIVDAPVIIKRVFTEAGFYEVLITPEESVMLANGAEYDFNQILTDGTRLKLTDNGKIILRKSVGDDLGW
ncbi:hypothetical protein [Mycoplasmopsis bovirhinis]|uniref:hypothetical protein n=1 Tax=Mycoplasmopsis bovirhinis TaxID=29553 RepID=UPI000E71E7A9|nr:hypothetical protein [Mycoplasmopsis bovirhinis]